MHRSIQQLPSRYEPLVRMLGDNARTTFVRLEPELEAIARLLHQAKAAYQGKFQFIYSPVQSGAGKTTFVQSLDIFLGDLVEAVHRIQASSGGIFDHILQNIHSLPSSHKSHIINLDGHESFIAKDDEYRSFLVQLNSLLRNRSDIVVLWPTNDLQFAEKIIDIMKSVGGNSPFGACPIYNMNGPQKVDFSKILDGILKVANWRLEDAALDYSQVGIITKDSTNIGEYLDTIQSAIARNFDVGVIGFEPPRILFVVSGGKADIRDRCRSLRRADSYYIDSARLKMYTRKSKIARWWDERNKDVKTSLAYIVSLFDAQLLSLTPSSVVHSVLMSNDACFPFVGNLATKNAANANKVMQSTEFFKFSLGHEVDIKEVKTSTKFETIQAYGSIQERSKDSHKILNTAIFNLATECGSGFRDVAYEQTYGHVGRVGVDAVAMLNGTKCHLEFFHKATSESTENRMAIYILEKLKEYAINFGVAKP